MSVAFAKVEGVRNVDVSLEAGTVTLALTPGNHLTLRRVREIVRKNGFTPQAASVEVKGGATERGGKPALAVSGTDEVLLLATPAPAGTLSGRVDPGEPLVLRKP